MADKSKELKKLLEQYDGDVSQLTKDAQQLVKKKSSKKKTSAQRGPVIASLKDVTKRYGKGDGQVAAVSGVDLDIHEGEILAIVGPSGSGKSTLMNLIGGLDTPTSGSVTVNGTDISHLNDSQLSRYRRETIGFVFQFFYLQPFLDVQQNIEIPMMFSRKRRSSRHQVSTELIQRVGLEEREYHLPRQLSGGQIQRAAIARALANRPKIVLADEPTGNLDSTNGQQIMKLFEQIRTEHKTAVVIVTHDESVAQQADRIVSLSDGSLA